jgi:hypothetical protein
LDYVQQAIMNRAPIIRGIRFAIWDSTRWIVVCHGAVGTNLVSYTLVEANLVVVRALLELSGPATSAISVRQKWPSMFKAFEIRTLSG